MTCGFNIKLPETELVQDSPMTDLSLQARVDRWMQLCFGQGISRDRAERNHRFLEEALELVQSLDCTRSEAHQLVDYVFDREVGETPQEIGGVMVTLAALCTAAGYDMDAAGEMELERILRPEIVEKIRAKQAAKPKHSPLPESPAGGENCELRVASTEEAAGHHKLDNDRQVRFYEQEFYVLSNFSSFNLMWHDILFPTSEHAYHWTKFRHPTGQGWLQSEIIGAPSGHEAFKIAERNKQYRRKDWDDVKVDIMREILRAKANQHEYVRRKLLETGDRELIEDSWRDDFWGWGKNRDGQNMLGKLWMEVRAELSAQSAEASK